MDDHNNETTTVYIGNLSNELSEEDLLETINFKDLELLKFCQNERKTFCFVDCGTHEKAANFVQNMNGFDIRGRRMIVKLLRNSTGKLKNFKSHDTEYSPFPISREGHSDKEKPVHRTSRDNSFIHEPLPLSKSDSEDDLPPLKPVGSLENQPIHSITHGLSMCKLGDPMPLPSSSHREGNGSCHSTCSPGIYSPSEARKLHHNHDVPSIQDCSMHTESSRSSHSKFASPPQQNCRVHQMPEMSPEHCETHTQSNRCMPQCGHRPQSDHSQWPNHGHMQPNNGFRHNKYAQRAQPNKHVHLPTRHTQEHEDKYDYQPVDEYKHQPYDRSGQKPCGGYGQSSCDTYSQHKPYISNKNSSYSSNFASHSSGRSFSNRGNRGRWNNSRSQSGTYLPSSHKFHSDAVEVHAPTRGSIPHRLRFPRQRGTFHPGNQYSQQPRTVIQDTYSSGHPAPRRVVNFTAYSVSRQRCQEEQLETEEVEEVECVLSVANFPYGTTEEMIYELFEDFNPVDVIMVCNGPDSNYDITEAYVILPSEDLAQEAIVSLDNAQYKHRTLILIHVTDEGILEEIFT